MNKREFLKTSATLVALSPLAAFNANCNLFAESAPIPSSSRTQGHVNPDLTLNAPMVIYFTSESYYLKGLESQSSDGTEWGSAFFVGEYPNWHSSDLSPAFCQGSASNSVYLAYAGTGGKNELLLTYSSDGSNFGGAYAIAGQTTKFAPAMALVGGYGFQLMVAFVADNSRNEIYTIITQNGGADASAITWNKPAIVPNQTTQFAPALTIWSPPGISFQSVLAYVANNNTNQLLVSTCQAARDWSKPTLVQAPGDTPQSSKSSPAITSFYNGSDVILVMAYVANNSSNSLIVTTSKDGVNWTTDELVGYTSATSPSLLQAMTPENEPVLFMAYVADDGSNDLVVITSTDALNWQPLFTFTNRYSYFAPCLGSLSTM